MRAKHFFHYLYAGILACQVLSANPEGFKVLTGEAAPPILDGQGVMTVQSQGRAIIQWDTFSLGAAERFCFQQAGVNPAVLNRVVGGDESKILGQLFSNGQVYLLNPHGVLIGPEARIECAGFIASSLDVLDADFLAERALLFSGDSESAVVNLGTISSSVGNIALIGRMVKNEGTIEAPQGKVGLGVGAQVLLQPESTPYIIIRACVAGEKSVEETASLTHAGSIKALSAEVKSSSSVYAMAIQDKGVIEALSFSEEGGEIYLVAEGGALEIEGASIKASSDTGKGGVIHALGDEVYIRGSTLKASGKTGGGTVLVGGDFQGSNPDIQNAKRTFIDAESVINADAIEEGNGGRVIVWGDEATCFLGNINIRGGSKKGDGGFAEVSGHYLDYQGFTNANAECGKIGELLLDPSNITISTAADSAGSFVTNSWLSTANASNINTTTLQTQLNGASTTISTANTSGAFDGNVTGSITVSNAVSWSAGTTLTMRADGFIAINASITNTGGTFPFTAMSFRAFGSTGVVATGLTIAAGQTVSSVNGTIILQGQGVGSGNAGVLVSGSVISNFGDVVFQRCMGGAVTAGNGVTIASGASVLASNILATQNIFGGIGSGNNFGFDISGTVGSAATKQILITTVSQGTGSSEDGIFIRNGGSLTVGDGGTISLVGMAGGLYNNAAGTGNIGIMLNTGSITAGTVGGSGLNTINITGLGGSGGGGGHHGVSFTAANTFSINLQGTNPGNSLNFMDCLGGSGGGGNNGVVFSQSVALVNGSMTFQNVTGGSGGSAQLGVLVQSAAVVSAPSIIATDVMGGPGTANDQGFVVTGPTSALGSLATKLISITAGSLGLLSAEIGITVNGGGLLQVGDGGTINLVGTGGGTYNSTGSTNYGVFFNNAIITAGSGGSGVNTINITGIGGSGTGGSQRGVQIQTSFAVNLNGTNNQDSLNFLNCVGGIGGSTNHGISWSASTTLARGTMNFKNITGGSGTSQNFGVSLLNNTVIAPVIIASDIMGGTSNSLDVGFNLSNMQLGGIGTNLISITAGSLGTGSSESGIALATSGITVGDGGTITLIGTGGGNYNTTVGTANSGVVFNGATLTAGNGGSSTNTINITGIGGTGGGGSHMGVFMTTGAFAVNLTGTSNQDSLNFLNCVGGTGGNNNHGVNWGVATTLAHGTLNFQNITGGGSGAGNTNHGLAISAAVSAPVIIATDLMGGPGFGVSAATGNAGLSLTSTLGSSGTNRIQITAGSLGTGSSEFGIYLNTPASIQVGDGGTITLTGTGGGFYNGAGSNNFGVNFGNTGTLNLIAGNGGTLANTINITGIGGAGSGGTHHGVNITPTTFLVNLNGTNTNDSLNFLNCVGGIGGNTNHGVNWGTTMTLAHGTLNFNNLTGGGSGASNTNYGLAIGAAVSAPVIIGNDLMGGPGFGTNTNTGNAGFSLTSTLGSSSTNRIQMTAGSLGTGGSEFGIYLNTPTAIQVGNGGTITLVGTGGGIYNGTGTSNIGVMSSSIIFQAGAGGSLQNTVNITGIGGSGSGGLHHGVNIAGAVAVILNGTNEADSINFLNCVGGVGGNVNSGVAWDANCTMIRGTLRFQNITGGGTATSNSNRGIFLLPTRALIAPTIIATDIMGGPGNSADSGFNVNNSQLGSSATHTISITAGSLGIGSSEVGILIDLGGRVLVGDGGTITLVGTGGGLYSNSTGTLNHGVNFTNTIALTAGNGGSSQNTINITGIGGAGGGGSHHGVNIDTASFTLRLNGTGNADSANFLNCVGGTGGNGNFGVNWAIATSMQHGTLNFSNITGGSGIAGHRGVFINANVTAPSIIASDVMGGPGTSANRGFYIQSAQLGDSRTGTISITAGSLGLFDIERGIEVISSTIAVGEGGTITLIGTGGGLYNAAGSTNHGVSFSTGTLTAGNGGSGLNTINITGIGGNGSAGSNYGVNCQGLTVNFNGSNPANSVNFLNCVGGSVGSNNYGLGITSTFSVVKGTLNFSNITGGGSGASNTNYGLSIGGTVSAPSIIGTDIMGGPGLGTSAATGNAGVSLTSTLGSSTTNLIRITAGSLGTGSNEFGIYVNAGTMQVGDGGTINLIGTGGGVYNSAGGTNNYGINFAGTGTVTLTAGSGGSTTNTINITGIGGSSSTPTATASNHHGVNISPTVAFVLNLNGTSNQDSINFLNCLGGNAGVGTDNYGINWARATALVHGTLNFSNITGGTSTSSSNIGLNISVNLSAPAIIANDVMGGPGSGNNIGIRQTAGILGSSGTKLIQLTGGSLGISASGAGNNGMQFTGTVQVGDGGTISLVGTGGGSYASNGTGNMGIQFGSATLIAGTGGSGLNTINITGIGGAGSSGAHYGVEVNIPSITLNGTNPNNSVNFLNCVGGTGGDNNRGISFINGFTLVNGTLNIQNVTGGSGGVNTNGHHGVVFDDLVVINVPSIIISDVMAGSGVGTTFPLGNFGVYVFGAQLGGASTKQLQISAGSLGTGSSEMGIVVDGTTNGPGIIQIGGGGTMVLTGTGGGLYSNSTGASNYGLYIGNTDNGGQIIVGTSTGGSTATLTGIGGSGGGGLHHGLDWAGNITLTSNNNTLNFFNCLGGSGGSGSSGFKKETGASFTALGTNSVNFKNCSGGTSLVNNAYGIDLGSNFSLIGPLNFSDITGGSPGTTNYGIYVRSGVRVTASTITAVDIMGGAGVSNNFGFYNQGGQIGDTGTGSISITAGSLGTASNEQGIVADTNGSFRVGNGGTITLIGTGGGLYSNAAGANNYGVNLNGAILTAGNGGTATNTINITGIGGSGSAATSNHHGVNIGTSLAINLNGTSNQDILNFLNCVGGSGGNNNYGINWGASLTLVHGAMQFNNITGGTRGANNYGVLIGANVNAPTIIASDVMGGAGTLNDYGFYVSSGQLGNSNTYKISITAGSLGTGSSENGIQLVSNMMVGDGGTITLIGTGGGIYNSSGANNYGVSFSGGTLTAGNGGNAINTINITGIGGNGNGGSNHGVSFASGFINLNGTGNQDSVNFLNCVGGAGGAGISWTSALTLAHGTLNFQNISGGSQLANNYGFLLQANMSAPVIIFSDLMGGAGTGNDYGLYVLGATLGGPATNRVQISAGSLGTGSSEIGIVVDTGGIIQVGDNGIIKLTGTGGGLYNGAGANNYGISVINNGSIRAGNSLGNATVTFTGIGGSGTTGSHHGVNIEGNITLIGNNNTLNFANCLGGNGTGSVGVRFAAGSTLTALGRNSANFTNCTGGTSVASNDYGLEYAADFQIIGPLYLSDISGGSSGTDNYGVYIHTGVRVTASTITAVDIMGGGGVDNNFGFYNQGGQLGDTGTGAISIIAGSLGMGSNENGIVVDTNGSVMVGDGGTIILIGTGGGLYSNVNGANNHGVSLNGALLSAGNGGSPKNTINITGIGGTGAAATSNHHGVNIETSLAVHLNGTNNDDSLNFVNCVGGSGGTSNYGVNWTVPTTLVHGLLSFNNITGSGNNTSSLNMGVTITSTVVAPVIIATDVMGGPGTTLDVGFGIVGGQLGDSTTKMISITAGSLGIGQAEHGISVSGGGQIIVGDGGTITLIGTGGGIYNSANGSCIGVSLNGAVLTAGAGGSLTNTINITGIGGTGTAGGNLGVFIGTSFALNLNGTSTEDSVNFINCLGGMGGNSNAGLTWAAPTTLVHGTLNFSNITGGGSSSSNTNYGVTIGVAVSAPVIVATDIMGGSGTGMAPPSAGNIGFILSGNTLGSSITRSIKITAGSLGMGINEIGIFLNIASMDVGDGGTITLIGTGGGIYNNSTASGNVGVMLTSASFTAGAGGNGLNTINITGIGGTGVGGSHHGVNVTGTLTVDLNGTNDGDSLNFLNCMGGTGGNANMGIAWDALFTMVRGALNFQNITGGGSAGFTDNRGLFVFNNATMIAPSIIATDIMGGPGSGTNYGVYFAASQIGSTATHLISITAGSLGTGSNEVGIRIDTGCRISVGDGGTINLIGTGGGLYSSSTGTLNHGLSFGPLTMSAGNGSALQNTINITGIGGTGGGGSHHGVQINTSILFNINLNGTNDADSLNFLNCVGGTGGTANYGIRWLRSLALQHGTLRFTNVTGGSGGAGGNYGMIIDSATVTAPNIIANDIMGGPAQDVNRGFYLQSAVLGNAGTERISITGGSLGTGIINVGVEVISSSIVVGEGGTITLVGTGGGVYNGTGTTNHGVEFSSGTLVAGAGGNELNTINITGIGGSGTTGANYGVNCRGLTIDLIGTNPANSLNFLNCVGGVVGSNNHGVHIDTSPVTFLSGGSMNFFNITGGGSGDFTNNYGIFLSVNLSAPNIIASDVMGGPGRGTSLGTGNFGLYVSGATLGGVNTKRLQFSAGSLGTGSFEIGIVVDNTSGLIQVGDGGTMILTGTGGGLYNSTGASNYGLYVGNNGTDGSIQIGNSAGGATGTLTGIAGSGLGGTHHGIDIAGNITLTGSNNTLNFLNSLGGSGGTNNIGVLLASTSTFTALGTNSVNFTNCTGGSGGVVGTHYGIDFGANFQLASGALSFSNITGGTSGSTNYGIIVEAARTVSASTIIATDIMGGAGSGSDFGFYALGQVGNAGTGRISITAGSLGTGSSEVGIQLDGTATVRAGDGGIISLIGTGGGVYNSAVSANYGVNLNGTTLISGNGGSAAGTINVTGIGGSGTVGSNYGVNISGLTATLNSTNNGNSLNFLNCVGGIVGSNNHGVHIDTSPIALSGGSLNFFNITGGGSANDTNNYGIFLGANLSSPSIMGADIMGGPGRGTSATTGNFGLYVAGATLGGNITNRIILSAGSLGTGSFEIGIMVDDNNTATPGIIQVTDGGIMQLTGTGGGLYNSTGANNYGIYISNGQAAGQGRLLIGNTTGSATSTLTGIGGTGSNGAHIGVNIAGLLTVTGAGNTLSFSNCLGGTGGSGNTAVDFTGTLSSTGINTFNFTNCTGGTGNPSGNDYGVRFGANFQPLVGAINLSNITGGGFNTTGSYAVLVPTGITVSASTIIASDIMGGAGIGSDIGFYVNGGHVGNTGTELVSITAGSLGTVNSEVGIQIDTSGSIVVGDGGTITLVGTGGGAYNSTGSANYGINFSTASLSAGNGGTGLNTINITGIGGSGTTGANYGVNINGLTLNLDGTNNANSLNFLNCVGGTVGSNNHGIHVASALSLVSGAITFNNVTGGGSGAFTNNYGIFAGANISAPSIIGADITGGPGRGTSATNGNYGLYVAGATFGGAITKRISLSAGSLGTGSFEFGIQINDNGTGTPGIIQIGDNGTMRIVGTGGGLYNSTGSNNYGISISNTTTVGGRITLGNSVGGATATLNGIGGTGTGGIHNGLDWAGNITLTGNSNILNFFNCLGGNGGSNSSGVKMEATGTLTAPGVNTVTYKNCVGGTSFSSNDYGLDFAANFQITGPLSFSDISGGSAGTDNYGIFIENGVIVSASTIFATDIMGGAGVNNNYGFYINGGQLGNAGTGMVSITAGSLGGGNSEIGIFIDSSGSVVVGDGGTITLLGTGGGSYNNAGTGNYGVGFSTGVLTAGSVGGTGLNTITVSGFGGTGSGGTHYGVSIDGLTANLNGTNGGNTLNFTNSVGGSGGNDNYGVQVGSAISLTNGTLNFKNITGGGTTTSLNNFGVNVIANISAPTILGSDIVGGNGSGTTSANGNFGFYVHGGAVVGSTSTHILSISAASLGRGSFEIGINVDGGSLSIGNGGTLILFGTGGGVYNSSTGHDNYGVNLSNATLTAAAGAGLDTMNITGLGGTGAAATSNHHGVNLGPFAVTLTFNGSNVNNSVNFLNSMGGSGGNNNYGVNVGANVTLNSEILNFKNITGGGSPSSTNNYGVYVPTGVTVSAPTIGATNIAGGPGSGSNIGFYVNGGTVGSSSTTTSLTILARSLGIGTGEVGIQVDNSGSIRIADTGVGESLTLDGTGGGSLTGAGANNYGFNITPAGSQILIGSSTGATAYLLAQGGLGSGGGHYGVNWAGSLTMTGAASNFQFAKAVGGLGGTQAGVVPNNAGLVIANSLTPTTGTLGFLNIEGGGPLPAQVGACANNYGLVILSGQTLSAETLSLTNVLSGTGSSNNLGMYVNGGLLGSASLANQTITVIAESRGTSSSETGFKIDSSGTIQCGATGTISITGIGSSHSTAGASNFGVHLAGENITLGATSTLTFLGRGGTGTGTCHGLSIDTAAPVITLPGTSSISFNKCQGGVSTGSNNYGVNFAVDFTAPGGTFALSLIEGGIGTTANHGVFIASTSTVSASTVSCSDIISGPSSGGGDIGFYVNGGTLGNTVGSSAISVSAEGASGVGIQLDNNGRIISGAGAGTITLNGTGGKAASNAHGVVVTGASSTVSSVNGNLTISGVGNLGHGVTVNTGGIVTTTGAGNIAINGVSGGVTATLYHGVTLTDAGNVSASGAGTITLQGATGSTAALAGGVNIASGISVTTASGAIAITGVHNAPIIFGSCTITSGASTISVNGPVTLTASTATLSGVGITFSSTIDGAFALSANANAGVLTFGGAVGSTTPLTQLTTLGASFVLGGNITTTTASGAISMANPVTLTNDVTVTTQNTSITLGGTVNGTGAYQQSLVLNPGANTISIPGVIGGVVPIGDFRIVTATGALFGNTINASSVVQTAGTGLTSFGGAINTDATGAGYFNGTGVNLNGPTFSFAGNVTEANGGAFTVATPAVLRANIAIDTSAGNGGITFGSTLNGTVSGAESLTLNAGQGFVLFSNTIGATTPIGNLTDTNSSNVTFSNTVTTGGAVSIVHTGVLTIPTGSTITAAGGFTESGTGGTVRIGANITSTATNIAFNTPVVLTANLVLTSNGGNISFSSGSPINGANNLTVNAGTGIPSFGAPIGTQLSPIGALVVTSTNVAGLTLAELPIYAASAVFNTAITLTTGPSLVDTSANNGVITFNGTINGGQNLTATSGSGVISLTGAVGTVTPVGALSLTTTGGISIGAAVGSIIASSAAFNGAVTYSSNLLVNTSAANGAVTFTSTVTGGNNFAITSGTGTISLGGNITTAGGGTVSVTGPTLLIGNITVNTSAAPSGTITFTGTVDGEGNFILNAGTSTITITASVGGITPIGSFTATTSLLQIAGELFTHNAPINTTAAPLSLTGNTIITSSFLDGNPAGAITLGTVTGAHQLTLSSGSATTTLSGAASIASLVVQNTGTLTTNALVTTTGAINVSAATVNINQGFSSGGNVSITHTGTLTIASPGTAVMTGTATFTESGGGTTVLNTSVTTANGAITFNDPILLTGSSTISNSSTANAINFNSTINGASAFIVTGGTGTTTFAQRVGNVTPPLSFLVTAGSIQIGASQIINASGFGSMSYTGPVTITGPVTFINRGTSTMTFSSSIAGNFPLTINAVGAAVTVGGAINLSGTQGMPLHIDAGGAVTLNGNINTVGSSTVGGDINVTSIGSNVLVMDIDAHGATEGGSVVLQPAETFTVTVNGNIPNGLLQLNGTVIDTSGGNANGLVALSPLGRSAVMSVATITGTDDLSVTSGTFIMGAREAMTIFGDIDLSMTGYSGLADIVSPETITISAGTTSPANFLVSRQAGNILRNDGTLYGSPNTHILANNNVIIVNGETPTGLNVGVTPITTADLLYMGTVLNYDSQSTPPIPPNPPVPPAPTPHIPLPRDQIIMRLIVAGTEMEKRLPIFWPDWHYGFWGKICPWYATRLCISPAMVFTAFIFENDVW